MENKELIRKVFHLLFEDVHLDRNVISQYLPPVEKAAVLVESGYLGHFCRGQLKV